MVQSTLPIYPARHTAQQDHDKILLDSCLKQGAKQTAPDGTNGGAKHFIKSKPTPV